MNGNTVSQEEKNAYVQRCKVYLAENDYFVPDDFFDDATDDDIIAKAHRIHHQDLCKHFVYVGESDNDGENSSYRKENDYYINENSICACNGYNDDGEFIAQYYREFAFYSDQEEEFSDGEEEFSEDRRRPCCHKRMGVGISTAL